MEFRKEIDGVRCPYPFKVGVCMMLFALVSSAEPLAPAVYVFGDSLADVGNNNYLEISVAKANFPHNGVDFPTHKPTGRFSNGKSSADLLAEKLGLFSPPPYLYTVRAKMNNFQTGANFASGGAGLFNSTDLLLKQSVPITKQIEYYSRVRNQMKLQLSESELRNLQSKAIHVIIVGSNDIIDYFKPSLNISKQMDPAEFVGFMLTTIKAQLQRVYDLGGRKFMMLGLAVVGCCPQQRVKSITGDCNALANTMSLGYNNGLRSVLEQLKAQLNGFHYSYFDTYNIVQNFTQNPQLFGFKEVKSACCGLGNLNADVPCIPLSIYCPNRSDHLFWDLYHPTEAADRFVIDAAFDDKLHYTYPINLRQLVSI